MNWRERSKTSPISPVIFTYTKTFITMCVDYVTTHKNVEESSRDRSDRNRNSWHALVLREITDVKHLRHPGFLRNSPFFSNYFNLFPSLRASPFNTQYLVIFVVLFIRRRLILILLFYVFLPLLFYSSYLSLHSTSTKTFSSDTGPSSPCP